MGVHDVEILVALEDAHVHVAHRLGEFGDDGNDVDRVATPVFTEDKQMPLPMQRFDAGGNLQGYRRAMRERDPHLPVLYRGTSHELAECLAFVIACPGNHIGLVTTGVSFVIDAASASCRRA